VSTPNVRCTLWWGPRANGHFIHAGFPLDPEFFFFFFFQLCPWRRYLSGVTIKRIGFTWFNTGSGF
jgi:hypothetical protein